MNILISKNTQLKEDFDWGSLIWYASAKLDNSKAMTLGKCIIKPGKSNPLHYHPNCEEILLVTEGTIVHTFEGMEDFIMHPGDSITIPRNVQHHAVNIGDEDAIMHISFSSNQRETIKVE